jgi:hypothetical protein
MMADDNNGLVAAGASLVWRRQRVLWWVYAVNLILGVLGAVGAHAELSKVLRYSLAGESLTKGFDLGMYFELTDQPAVNLMRSAGSSVLFALLFPLFMLFVTGGILAVYREDRRLTTGEFFAAAGAFFWRFVRLAIFSLVPFALIGMALSGVRRLSAYIGDRVIAAQTGFYILLAGAVIVVLLLLFVRLWFDIAQVRAVVQDERRMWPNIWKALGISWRNRLTLFRVYLCISGVAWAVLAVGMFVWSKLPPAATAVTFVLLQLVILTQLGVRLWQRATAMTWYQRHAVIVPADTVEFTTPAPVEVIKPEAPPADDTPQAPEEGPAA